MTTASPGAAPRLRRTAARLAWISAVGGLALALVLALLGVGAARGGGDLFVELIPAILAVGIGMAAPPYLLALAALALVGGHRSPRVEMIAAAVGAVIGAFVSPVAFYAGFPALGLVVALVIAAVAGIGFPLVVRALWRRAS